MEKLQSAFLWPAEVEAEGRKKAESLIHPFRNFPCFSFLIFCFHSFSVLLYSNNNSNNLLLSQILLASAETVTERERGNISQSQKAVSRNSETKYQ